MADISSNDPRGIEVVTLLVRSGR